LMIVFFIVLLLAIYLIGGSTIARCEKNPQQAKAILR